ncbi:aminodeoxychorismate lyase [Neobacillus sp. PS3-40]|uniref:aminodeoxychorismate lyase n=1 Tax=Neobacillus sp. PS3-40 TaxID=3070679 RepID=UPI0027DF531F|nr:aminodeoxychorismate lyase [Neobacillus sp. PS3-40]WML45317.1 aminodeoxychorismate lyase [Neobacillus sp. PS3-40]
MNNRGIRAFSLGMIFTVSILGSYYFSFEEGSQRHLKTSDAKILLEKNGYKILTSDEYKMLRGKKSNTLSKKIPSKKALELSKSKPKVQPNNQAIPQGNNEISYRLQVLSGMNSGDITSLLAEHKIIENEGEFQQYLITHQYQARVQLGTYDLTNKMNYDQIAKTITKSE